jgi:hypothetical protein
VLSPFAVEGAPAGQEGKTCLRFRETPALATSTKVRNPKLDAPDAWEEQVLRKFEARKAAGEDVQAMAYAEIVNMDGRKHYRFMKGIPTGPLCLACHGTSVTPEVASALHNPYPNDLATGYEFGDIRGAFTLSKPM